MGVSTYQNTINAAAASNNIPPALLTSVIQQESSGNPNAVAPYPYGTQGLAQITQGTWNSLYPGVPYSLDPTDQINAAATLLGQYNQEYGGNTALMAVAYNGGPGVANLAASYIAQGQDSSTAIVNATQNYTNADGSHLSSTGGLLGTGKQGEIQDYANRVASTNIQLQASGTSSQGLTPSITVNDALAGDYIPVAGSPISAAQSAAVLQAIAPSLVISSGLDETPWFNNQAIVQVNGATRTVQTPIQFQVYFDNPHKPLSSKQGPISVKLNASLTRQETAMRHIVNKQQTRTGVLLTLWEMEPDIISGSGSTGMFVSQFGLTDYMSLANIPDTVQQQIDQQNSDDSDAPATPQDSMRIAAKDAFLELLALFRDNGLVWFRNQNYTGYTTSSQQESTDVWSPQTGSTMFQNSARRNDVMARGGVILTFRNVNYYGYFTQLSWTEDAAKPFSWNFTFTFKVERTLKTISVPSGQ